MTMQVGVGESASRPISRFRHGFAACAGCCEPRRFLSLFGDGGAGDEEGAESEI